MWLKMQVRFTALNKQRRTFDPHVPQNEDKQPLDAVVHIDAAAAWRSEEAASGDHSHTFPPRSTFLVFSRHSPHCFKSSSRCSSSCSFHAFQGDGRTLCPMAQPPRSQTAKFLLLLDSAPSHACRLACNHCRTVLHGTIEFQPPCSADLSPSDFF